ncbi:MAG TPA: M28 family peptidase [Gaiellaceae bacterium]|nr:M28 family peptidase [Gaiellaceae bacterium]
MAAAPARSQYRRPRPGSLERPVSARMYRGTWLLVGLPLLVAAFSVARPTPLPAPPLPPAFDRNAATALATDLARSFPDRSPGSPGATGAVQWFEQQLQAYGFRTQVERFEATIPGRGRVRLENLSTVAPGSSPDTIVVMAHRDNAGTSPGANDNASGTAALIELARGYANVGGGRRATPAHRILFLSTDGGAFGGLGAEHFAAKAARRKDVVAVVNLDSLAGTGRPRLEIAGDTARSPAASLVETAALRLLEQTGARPARPSALRQLLDLAFPFSLYEQAPFVGRGIPAITLTSAGDRPPPAFGDTPEHLDRIRLTQLGGSAQELISSLDQGLDLAQGTSTYVYLGSRIVRGWAIELVLIATLLPFFAATVDLFARCRRRRIPLAPALRSYLSRLGFWLLVGGLFELFALAGAWPGGAQVPPAPVSPVATHWPVAATLGFLVACGAAWLVARDRLLPRRRIGPGEEVAGYTAALLALGVVSLLVVATNAFALVLLLPSLHAWLWLPESRARPPWTRAAILVAGFAGPLLLLWSLGSRFGLGLHAPWYLLELTALGYVGLPALAITLAWAAAAAQLVALAAGRYAPYPAPGERPPRGPLRELVRKVVIARRARRRVAVVG